MGYKVECLGWTAVGLESAAAETAAAAAIAAFCVIGVRVWVIG